ncbi:MAG: hypothetical protein Q4P06_02320 [Actinomycetaceae bacterium]|nr:hypothetical protein [Actinomycetaceae bacterium]
MPSPISAEQAKKLRHPWHDRIIVISATVTIALVVIAVVAIALILTRNLQLGSLSPTMHNIVALAIAIVVVVPALLMFTRSTETARPKVTGAVVSPTQFPQVHALTRHYCELVGLEQLPKVVICRGSTSLASSSVRFAHAVITLHPDLVENHREDGRRAALEFALAREIGLVATGERTFTSQFLSAITQVTPYLSRVAQRAEEYTADLWGALLAPSAAADYFAVVSCGKVLWAKANMRDIAQQAGRGGLSETVTNWLLETPPLPWRLLGLSQLGVFRAERLAIYARYQHLRLELQAVGTSQSDGSFHALTHEAVARVFADMDIRNHASFWRRPRPLSQSQLASQFDDCAVADLAAQVKRMSMPD